MGSGAGRGRGLGARVAGFTGRVAAGRCARMCGDEAAAEISVQCRGERSDTLLLPLQVLQVLKRDCSQFNHRLQEDLNT